MTTKTGFTIPKTLAGCADRLGQLKDLIAAASRAVEALEDERKAINEHLIEQLPKGEATGISGRTHRVYVELKYKPQVQDWDTFWAKFDKKKDRDLLQRRVSESAVQERWDNNKQVPGVVAIALPVVRLNKV